MSADQVPPRPGKPADRPAWDRTYHTPIPGDAARTDAADRTYDALGLPVEKEAEHG